MSFVIWITSISLLNAYFILIPNSLIYMETIHDFVHLRNVGNGHPQLCSLLCSSGYDPLKYVERLINVIATYVTQEKLTLNVKGRQRI